MEPGVIYSPLPPPPTVDQVVAAIRARAGSDPQCDVCGKADWTLAEGFPTITALDRPDVCGGARGLLPCVALVCNDCGHTLLFNTERLLR